MRFLDNFLNTKNKWAREIVRYADDYKLVNDPETGKEDVVYCGDIYFWDLSEQEHKKRRVLCVGAAVALFAVSIAFGFIRNNVVILFPANGLYGLTEASLFFLLFETIRAAMLGRQLESKELNGPVKKTRLASVIAVAVSSASFAAAVFVYVKYRHILNDSGNILYIIGTFVTAAGCWSVLFLLKHYMDKITLEDGTLLKDIRY